MDDQELLQLVDRQEIINLLERSVHALHAKWWRRLADCFTADASAQLHGRHVSGRDAIIESYRADLRDFHPGERSSGEYSVEIASGVASTFTRVLVEHIRASDASSAVLGHVDRDLMVRTSEGWKVARRGCVLSWITLDARLADATGLKPFADAAP
jgi:hypothetical protein